MFCSTPSALASFIPSILSCQVFQAAGRRPQARRRSRREQPCRALVDRAILTSTVDRLRNTFLPSYLPTFPPSPSCLPPPAFPSCIPAPAFPLARSCIMQRMPRRPAPRCNTQQHNPPLHFSASAPKSLSSSFPLSSRFGTPLIIPISNNCEDAISLQGYIDRQGEQKRINHYKDGQMVKPRVRLQQVPSSVFASSVQIVMADAKCYSLGTKRFTPASTAAS